MIIPTKASILLIQIGTNSLLLKTDILEKIASDKHMH